MPHSQPAQVPPCLLQACDGNANTPNTRLQAAQLFCTHLNPSKPVQNQFKPVCLNQFKPSARSPGCLSRQMQPLQQHPGRQRPPPGQPPVLGCRQAQQTPAQRHQQQPPGPGCSAGRGYPCCSSRIIIIFSIGFSDMCSRNGALWCRQMQRAYAFLASGCMPINWPQVDQPMTGRTCDSRIDGAGTLAP